MITSSNLCCLGALTNMPAVRVFSLYAAMAVLFDFLLQITVFIALLTFDAKRQKVHTPSALKNGDGTSSSYCQNLNLYSVNSHVNSMQWFKFCLYFNQANRLDMCCFVKLGNQKSGDKLKDSEGFLYKIVRDVYSHLLLKEWVRPIVVRRQPTHKDTQRHRETQKIQRDTADKCTNIPTTKVSSHKHCQKSPHSHTAHRHLHLISIHILLERFPIVYSMKYTSADT